MRRANWFQDIVSRYEAPLVRFATGIVGVRARGREVVQDTFLQLWKAEREQVEGHVAPWLYRVCRNRALDVIRKEGRNVNLKPRLEAVPPDSVPASAEQKTDAATAVAAIGRLPEDQREVVMLRFREGLSYRDIAAVTGKPVGTVGYLIHNALKTVRTHMEVQR
jgi:RNA polymerase sigma factor (sigma-70 family)